jgi:hypothetical protein
MKSHISAMHAVGRFSDLLNRVLIAAERGQV